VEQKKGAVKRWLMKKTNVVQADKNSHGGNKGKSGQNLGR